MRARAWKISGKFGGGLRLEESCYRYPTDHEAVLTLTSDSGRIESVKLTKEDVKELLHDVQELVSSWVGPE